MLLPILSLKAAVVGSGRVQYHLVHRGAADSAAVQGDSHALGIQGHDLMPHCLKHVAVELVHVWGHWKEIGQGCNVMSISLAQQHVVARIFAAAVRQRHEYLDRAGCI
jgi:hypothetical protein